MYKAIGRLAILSGAAAGVVLTASAASAEADQPADPDARQPALDADAPDVGDALPSAAESDGGRAERSDPGPTLPLPTVHDGWIELGDSRASATESQLERSGSETPPPSRADAGHIPRVGAGVKPSELDARWSYDVKSVVDTGAVTKDVPVPYPPVRSVLPGKLGPVDNQASHLEQDNRTAEGSRHATTVDDPGWNLTTTDVVAPGAGRVYRFDMVCPDHAGRHAAGGHGRPGQHDDVYTGYSDVNLGKGHQVFSYHWGDPAFNDAFVMAHYMAYGLSNTPPPENGSAAPSTAGHQR